MHRVQKFIVLSLAIFNFKSFTSRHRALSQPRKASTKREKVSTIYNTDCLRRCWLRLDYRIVRKKKQKRKIRRCCIVACSSSLTITSLRSYAQGLYASSFQSYDTDQQFSKALYHHFTSTKHQNNVM